MLKFWVVTVLFILLALAAGVFGFHWTMWGLIVLLVAAVLIYGSANVRSGFYLKAFSRGDPHSRKVALTFDDGPHPANTPLILEMLKGAGVKVVFFCIGEKADQYPELVARMAREGHLAGCHSWSHSPYFPMMPVRRIRQELEDTRKKIEEVTHRPCDLFRPPYGVTNPLLTRALIGLGFSVIGWSVRSFDLQGHSPARTVERIMSKLRGGDMVLLHDTSPQAPAILSGLLAQLEKGGWECVRADELLNLNTGGD